VENKLRSNFGFSIDINGKLLVSTEKKELKHDLGEKRHSTTTSHGRSKFMFLVLEVPKPYMKLSKFTKLNKLPAT